jgi:hypothetical protein
LTCDNNNRSREDNRLRGMVFLQESNQVYTLRWHGIHLMMNVSFVNLQKAAEKCFQKAVDVTPAMAHRLIYVWLLFASDRWRI